MKQFTKNHIGHKYQGQNSSLHLRDFIAPILNPYVLSLLRDGTRQRNVLVSKNKAHVNLPHKRNPKPGHLTAAVRWGGMGD